MFRVGPSLAAQYRNAKLKSGDLVMTVVGANTGQVEVAPAWLDGGVLSRSTARIAVDHRKAAPGFVQAVLVSPVGRRQVLNHTKEGAQPVVSCRDVASFSVAVPPLPEQRAIAAALTDVDALLGALDRLIAKKRDLKEAAMQELLTGQTRLPGFSGTWETLSLFALFDFRNGVNAEKSAYGAGTRFINVLEVITRSHLKAHHAPGRIALGRVRQESYRVRYGDVLFNRTSETQEEVGLAAVYEDDEDVVFGGFVIRARPKPDADLNHRFCGYALRAPRVRQQIIARGQGAIRANIGQSDLRKVMMSRPSRAEQTAIAAVLSDMDAELAALEARRDKTRLLKQGMMQQLLIGRTRLV
jgi:type I restriction enzyme S subunit